MFAYILSRLNILEEIRKFLDRGVIKRQHTVFLPRKEKKRLSKRLREKNHFLSDYIKIRFEKRYNEYISSNYFIDGLIG